MKIKALKEKFTSSLDFFQLEPKAEMRKSSPDFFAFFKKFNKEIEENLPKVVKR